MHTNARLLFNAHARTWFRPGARVLEIGPDQLPSTFMGLVADPSIQWDTLDINNRPGLTFRATKPYTFPIADETYDVVFASQVMEHIPRIWTWILELERVCRTGGLIVLITPVSWTFHEYPVDCWRIYPDGMRALLEETRFRVLECRFESLELPGFRRYLPGISLDWHSKPYQWLVKAAGRFIGFPVNRAYDLFTVAQKTAP